jgi:hypothetical protein
MKPAGSNMADGTVEQPGTDDRPATVDQPAPEQREAPASEGPTGERPADGRPGPELGERERRMLDFERKWWKHAGSKEQAIRDTFELSATRYYQLLNAVLDDPAALAYDPVVVGRLRRLRSTRSRARTPGPGRVA